jgi:hypothetical protein
MTSLTCSWNYYFHDPFDDNWERSSYTKLGETFSTVEDFWKIHNRIEEKVPIGMFFISRENVFPSWSDPSNVEGGCIAVKVLKTASKDFWQDICIKLLCNTLYEPNSTNITCVSISPKKNFCVIKVWLSDCSQYNIDEFNINNNYYGTVIFKKHT